MYFLWWYKYYRKIVREAMHFKTRELIRMMENEYEEKEQEKS